MNFDELDDCLDLLYNIVYNKNLEYKCHHIEKSKICIQHLKKSHQFNPDPILNGKIKQIAKINNKYFFKRYPDNENSYPVTLEIHAYDNEMDYVNLRSKECIHLLYLLLFSEYVINDKIPFIMLPIFNFDITDSKIKQYPVFKEITNNGKWFSVQMTEHYFNIEPLKSYLETVDVTSLNWKALLFQIIYVWCYIKSKYSNFIHGNYTFDSFWVYHTKKTEILSQYTLYDKLWNIPDIGIEIRLTSFENAKIEDVGDSKNEFVDMQVLFSELLELLKKKNISIVKEFIENFTDNVEITKIDTKKIIEKITFSINNLLTKNNFFENFIMKNKNRELNTTDINSEYINKFVTNSDFDVEYGKTDTAKDVSMSLEGKGKSDDEKESSKSSNSSATSATSATSESATESSSESNKKKKSKPKKEKKEDKGEEGLYKQIKRLRRQVKNLKSEFNRLKYRGFEPSYEGNTMPFGGTPNLMANTPFTGMNMPNLPNMGNMPNVPNFMGPAFAPPTNNFDFGNYQKNGQTQQQIQGPGQAFPQVSNFAQAGGKAPRSQKNVIEGRRTLNKNFF